ncbi:MAG TPA: CHASE3 domain-containing protein [Kofleriaceae bacterium]|nr:CHASE3 domain-containing protein [Kofleriaceae bacterium]
MLVGVVTYAMTNSQIDNARWVEHTHTVIETITSFSGRLAEAQNASRGYMMTGDADDLIVYQEAVRSAHLAEQQLRTLTADNARQQQRLDRLAPLTAGLLAHLDENIRHGSTNLTALEAVPARIRNGDAAMARLRPLFADLLAEERELLVDRDDVMRVGVTRKRVIQLSGAVVSLALLTFAFAALRREIRRRVESDVALRASEAATRQLNDELERRVHARTAELEASNRELESFSYSVAHDLRAPLRGLSGFSEILLDEYKDKLDEDGLDALQEIRDNARKMGVLIDALLSLSRVTRSELKSAAVDLSELVRATAGELQKAVPRLNFQLSVADNVQAKLDPLLARMLIANLVSNAWKFTSKMSASRIEFGTTATDGQRTFFVRDNGAGFDMAHAAKLFVPFHRLHTVTEFPGTGIGLSTAERIVARFGGRIWAEAQVDQGATFYFTLSDTAQGTTS